MIRITDTILIDAPINQVFDAERNISLHTNTQEHRGERAVDGVTIGLIDLNQEVEWEAIHFGLKQRLRVRITHMEKPRYFRDEMIKGAFASFSHEHHFREVAPNRTEKKDVLDIVAPLGPLGYIAERIFLRRYMTRFIREKNATLKRIIEANM